MLDREERTGSNRPSVMLCTQNDTQRWAYFRRQGVGASEISAVIGCSPWLSALELWRRKTSLADPAPPTNTAPHLRWGQAVEPAILQTVAKEAGVKLECSSGTLWTLSDNRRVLATPDGVTKDGMPIEVKNISDPAVQYTYVQNDIPEHYKWQIQQQLLVLDAPCGLFGASLGGRPPVWEWVAKDPIMWQRILSAINQFWELVESNTPPEPYGQAGESARETLKSFRGDGPELQWEDDEPFIQWSLLRQEERELQRQLKEKAALRTLSENMILHRLGSAKRAVTSSGYSVEWHTAERKAYTVDAHTVVSARIRTPKKEGK